MDRPMCQGECEVCATLGEVAQHGTGAWLCRDCWPHSDEGHLTDPPDAWSECDECRRLRADATRERERAERVEAERDEARRTMVSPEWRAIGMSAESRLASILEAVRGLDGAVDRACRSVFVADTDSGDELTVFVAAARAVVEAAKEQG